MLKPDATEVEALHLITDLQQAFSQVLTYCEITRIYQSGLDYRPIAIQAQACDVLTRAQ
jgi:hypothetical protein